MRDYRPMGHAPNYTKPFLVSFGLWLFCAMVLVAVTYGFATVLFVAAILDVGMQRLRKPKPSA